MSIRTTDVVDIGRVLAWAGRPRETPARHDDYHRVLTRYRNEPDFAAAVDAAFTGAGLFLIVDDRDGFVAMANPDSLLRVTATDIIKRAQPAHRAVIGAVILAIARVAYPEPAMVDDPDRLAVFTTQSVVDALDRAAKAYADKASEDGDIDDDLVEVWRRWEEQTTARPNAQRRSTSDRPGVVNRVCRFLVDSGYLIARAETDGGTWLARPRFRHAVAALCEDSDLYAIVNDLVGTSQPAGDGAGAADGEGTEDE